MQREQSASASAMRTSDVVFAFLWQVMLTSDPVTALSVLGAILVMIGVMIIVVFKSKSDEEPVVSNAEEGFSNSGYSSSSSNTVGSLLDCF